MPVRVVTKLKTLKGSKPDRIVETAALLNTGYTGSSPEIIVPVKLAEEIGLWPPPIDAIQSTYDTAGGPARFHTVRAAITLQIVDNDVASKELTADVAISPTEREVLLSDIVIGELEVVILNAHRGYWRFISDLMNYIRYSKKPELW
jgi:predicted aspartyl protease